MDKWEIKCRVVNISKGNLSITTSANNIFREKNDKGIIPFEVLQAEAKDGWELVSVTFISDDRIKETGELLFSFKEKLIK